MKLKGSGPFRRRLQDISSRRCVGRFILISLSYSMESGFTQHHSKGLFTFYREQAEPCKRAKCLLRPALAARERGEKKHYVSLSAYDKKQPANLQTSKELEPRTKAVTSRYSQAEQQAVKKPLSAASHVFEPRLVEKWPRKNGYLLQLMGVRNKISRSEIESYLKKQAKTRTEGRLIGGLSARQLPAREINQLFLPKKEHYAQLHAIKRSPLKLNAITAHCVEEPTDSREGTGRGHREEGRREGRKNGIMHTGREGALVSDGRHKISSEIFREIYESRRNKLESSSFWQDGKLKRDIASLKLHESVTYSNQTAWRQFEDSQLVLPEQNGSFTILPSS